MKAEEIVHLIETEFGKDAVTSQNLSVLQPYIYVSAANIAKVLKFLKYDDRTFFDLLSCLTGIDNGPEKNTMEVVYTLYSIPYAHALHVRVMLDRNAPELQTASFIWRTAEWHEREAFDLLGINFLGHPDLRRILLPANWEGYPLRKDYKEQETFHGIKVKY
jgi:NADH-quinone oxidoreductase subunit C